MANLKINSEAFFSNYIFHPFKKDLKGTDRLKAFFTSAALLVLTGGLFHAGCYVKYRNKTVSLKSSDVSNDKTKNVANNAKITPKIVKEPQLERNSNPPKIPDVPEQSDVPEQRDVPEQPDVPKQRDVVQQLDVPEQPDHVEVKGGEVLDVEVPKTEVARAGVKTHYSEEELKALPDEEIYKLISANPSYLDQDTKLKYLKIVANNGDLEAQKDLSKLYQKGTLFNDGLKVTQDFKESQMWEKQISVTLTSYCRLAEQYLDSKEKDVVKGEKYLLLAVKNAQKDADYPGINGVRITTEKGARGVIEKLSPETYRPKYTDEVLDKLSPDELSDFIFLTHQGVLDPKTELKYALKIAEEGHLPTQECLRLLYSRGRAGSLTARKSPNRELYWKEKIAENIDSEDKPLFCNQLAQIYLEGTQVTQNLQKGEKFLFLALAVHKDRYPTIDGQEIKSEQAAKELIAQKKAYVHNLAQDKIKNSEQTLGALNDADAIYDLISKDRFDQKQQTKLDQNVKLKYLIKIAEGGHYEAQTALHQFYTYGSVFESSLLGDKNKKVGDFWLEIKIRNRPAENNNMILRVAKRYLNGTQGVTQDLAKGKELLLIHLQNRVEGAKPLIIDEIPINTKDDIDSLIEKLKKEKSA